MPNSSMISIERVAALISAKGDPTEIAEQAAEVHKLLKGLHKSALDVYAGLNDLVYLVDSEEGKKIQSEMEGSIKQLNSVIKLVEELTK